MTTPQSTAKTRPKLALTPGEPAGIGPDLCVLLAQQSQWLEQAHITVIADPDVLQQRAELLDLPINITTEQSGHFGGGVLSVLPVRAKAAMQAGKLEPDNAQYVLDTLDVAIAGCQSDQFDAIVTAPVHKATINNAGIAFSGHTEYLAEACQHWPNNNQQPILPVMMLATPGLRVALVTTHLPLTKVPTAITAERIERVLSITDQDLKQRFGITKPQLQVCGLNPHAGEQGHLGREEIEVIEPTLQRLRDQGLTLTGPVPADTAFTVENIQRYDATIAMYHDQGLPVLKHKGFGNAVNITLGLPLIRTSVDHGTALDLAGTGDIDTGSLATAIDAAIEMSLHSHRQRNQ